MNLYVYQKFHSEVVYDALSIYPEDIHSEDVLLFDAYKNVIKGKSSQTKWCCQEKLFINNVNVIKRLKLRFTIVVLVLFFKITRNDTVTKINEINILNNSLAKPLFICLPKNPDND